MALHPVLQSLGLAARNPGAFLGGGEWSPVTGERELVVVNPSSGEELARVTSATGADYQALMARAQEAFLAWRMTPAPRRGEAVRLVGEALRRHKDALGSLVSLEMGKIKAEGDGEVQEMIDIADFAVGQSRMLYGLAMHSERPGHRMGEQYHPLGLVGVISAFNFPVAVWAWNAFLATVCGDVTVWKPSPKAPLSALAAVRVCNAALREGGFPELFFLFNEEGHALTQRLVDDKRVPLVSFTGSTEVGRQVAARVAQRLGRSLLELGGNNAIIVDATADLQLAIPAIVFGAVGTAGQRCTTTRRLLVHASLLDEVLARLSRAYRQVEGRIGDPLHPGTLMGPLIDGAAVRRFEQAVARAVEAGGRVVSGGKALPGPGNFVQPTLLVGVPPSHEVVQTETFAPILYVTPWETWEEAVALQNGVPQGLSSAVFTRDLATAERFLGAAGSDCGIANVNIGTSGAEIGGAFGGEKDTGGGRESGSDAWKVYMRRQTHTVNFSDALPLAQGIRFDL
jgi:aldehyde dehydrogenase (NAD+)